MGDLEIYGNDECDIMKINISEEEVLEQVEKTQAMKLKESRSVQKLNFRTERLARVQCDFEKQGCFPRLKNFPVPKYEESQINAGNADPRAKDAHCVQPWMRLIWACRIRPAGLQLSPLKPAKKSQQIKEAGNVSGFSKCFWQSSS